LSLRYAYNTNGIAHHRLDDALHLLADCGYDGVALTLDFQHFDPFAEAFAQRCDELASKLSRLKLGLVVETGARFLLNPRAKHEPTLLSPEADGRARRVEFLQRAIDVCAACGGEAVSFWAGVPRAGVMPAMAQRWLMEGVEKVLQYAEEKGVVAAFEPEPGMLVETVADYDELKARFPSLKLALDTGHVVANDEGAPEDFVRSHAADLGTVALEDMKRGVHEHLYFGDGDMDTAAILAALKEVEFSKLICIELSRDSHRADKLVPAAIHHLRSLEKSL